MAISELACTYAALILHDDGIPITVRVPSRRRLLNIESRLKEIVVIAFGVVKYYVRNLVPN